MNEMAKDLVISMVPGPLTPRVSPEGTHVWHRRTFGLAFQLAIKGTIDRVVGLIFLILFLPVLLLTALLVWLFLGSPVLFSQMRVGYKGKMFKIYKFRTMKDARESDGNLQPDRMRQTRLGTFLRRTKLDELPQLVLLVSGHMSLVGPRPLMAVPENKSIIQSHIHYALPSGGDLLDVVRREMKPGITGWSQVNGNTRFCLMDRFKLDAWYYRHFSLALDLKILVRTFLVLVRGERIEGAALEAARSEFCSEWFRTALNPAGDND